MTSKAPWHVPASQDIELSGWIKTIDAENVLMIIQCLYENGNMVGYRSTQQTTNIPGTADWQLYNVSINVPNETDKIIVMLVLEGTGQVWFDDVQLVVV